MGVTNFPNGVASFGVPVVSGSGIPATSGNVIWVDYTNGDDGRSIKSQSAQRPIKTVAKAYSMATTNKDDVIALIGSASHPVTEMLSVTKNRVHFIGVDGTDGRFYGQNAKIAMGVTTAATDIGAVSNTGVRNSFKNIKFTSANTKAESIYTFVEGGEYTVLQNCEFYKETDLDVTGAAELVMNGDSAQVIGCTIGSLANAISGAVIRPCVLLTKGVAGSGKVARDVTFIDCQLWRKAGHVNNRFVYGANADDVERMLLMERCKFVSNALGAATPAAAVGFGSAQTAGTVLLMDCASVDCTIMAQAAVGIFVAGSVPTFATTGVSVAS